uniref:Uncharacterized protein n=1 Tax=Octactis speculum TaxID=3111310 RepID=A0A7S2CSE6_9STRA|mmetsp:Transcript_39161/g.53093  ORF Transcript_39161/g.53093 Transcript_39161/m.53093 type:complete len:167 (+) Transcript_39161:70-570(+)|eukprot:CAMPEP_0185765648 /NCGR_PEP_ID=MMETSP1174-20130828/30938_1 /TAXON_ID=35687 /ORGANISM="Dictyocha speculum, Strain CCMP1381" /LENGTH=166 /DNA_ID=CAMNT_0028448905 /DNA_START=67 /DNA_END=567 /DNA_ORIENTATION=+
MSSCSTCDDLSDKECLSVLDADFTGLSDKARLSFAEDYMSDELANNCSGLSDKSCLATLDLSYQRLSDQGKLRVLRFACEAQDADASDIKTEDTVGSTATSFDAGQNGPPQPYLFFSTGGMMISSLVGLVLVLGAIVLSRRRRRYTRVPLGVTHFNIEMTNDDFVI